MKKAIEKENIHVDAKLVSNVIIITLQYLQDLMGTLIIQWLLVVLLLLLYNSILSVYRQKVLILELENKLLAREYKVKLLS